MAHPATPEGGSDDTVRRDVLAGASAATPNRSVATGTSAKDHHAEHDDRDAGAEHHPVDGDPGVRLGRTTDPDRPER